MADLKTLLVYSLIVLGLIVGPWIFWYGYAKIVTEIQVWWMKRKLRKMFPFVQEKPWEKE
jgi:hypothetical protein